MLQPHEGYNSNSDQSCSGPPSCASKASALAETDRKLTITARSTL